MLFLAANHPEVTTTHVPNQTFDVFYSSGNEDRGWGARLMLASVGSSPAVGNDSRSFVTGLTLGYGGAAGSLTYDSGLSVVVAHAGTDNSFGFTGHQVTFTNRIYKKTSKKTVQIGILADLTNGGSTYQAQGSEAEDFSGTRLDSVLVLSSRSGTAQFQRIRL